MYLFSGVFIKISLSVYQKFKKADGTLSLSEQNITSVTQ